jgi:hypothetical protein
LLQTVLRNHRTIRPILAGALLALFALAITPKIAIHALMAHHTDSHPSLNSGKSDQINQFGFHCTVDNLVVELPFLNHSFTLQLGLSLVVPVYRPAVLTEPLIAAHPLFGLRGPPALLPSC